MKKLPVARHLTDDEYKWFLETYAAHNSSMGSAMRDQYSAAKIVKVEKGNGYLRVYYEDGESWHYAPDRTWY